MEYNICCSGFVNKHRTPAACAHLQGNPSPVSLYNRGLFRVEHLGVIALHEREHGRGKPLASAVADVDLAGLPPLLQLVGCLHTRPEQVVARHLIAHHLPARRRSGAADGDGESWRVDAGGALFRVRRNVRNVKGHVDVRWVKCDGRKRRSSASLTPATVPPECTPMRNCIFSPAGVLRCSVVSCDSGTPRHALSSTANGS